MKHLRSITAGKASDSFGYVFLQLWLQTFIFLLTGAFGEAKDK